MLKWMPALLLPKRELLAFGLNRLSILQYRRLKDLVLKWMPVSHNKAIDGEAPEQGKQGGTPLLFALLARHALAVEVDACCSCTDGQLMPMVGCTSTAMFTAARPPGCQAISRQCGVEPQDPLCASSACR